MPVFMNDIATSGKEEHIRKSISNGARIEQEKKMSFGLRKQNIWQLKQREKRKKSMKH